MQDCWIGAVKVHHPVLDDQTNSSESFDIIMSGKVIRKLGYHKQVGFFFIKSE
jgi:hypothetical protein